jgi:hypothetical protein
VPHSPVFFGNFLSTKRPTERTRVNRSLKFRLRLRLISHANDFGSHAPYSTSKTSYTPPPPVAPGRQRAFC